MTGTGPTADQWAGRLAELGVAVRDAVGAARRAGQDMATPVAHEGGDTIFAIDRAVEAVIVQRIEAWPAAFKPLRLVAEGLGETGVLDFGDAEAPGRCRLIVDPIDGTRNIMYDKRAAWFLAAVTGPGAGDATVADAMAAAMVELPTAKAGSADLLTATAEGPVVGWRQSLADGSVTDLPLVPSSATDLRFGFAQVSNFFPGTKVLAATLMERIVEATLGAVPVGGAEVFDDQYISTGGQLVELIVGHDRFCCDLRPLFHRVIERRTGQAVRGLACHPYDMAGLLVARRAGVVVTDGFGRDLRPPLDVHSPVHWCGYANDSLRRAIEPVIAAFFLEHGVEPR